MNNDRAGMTLIEVVWMVALTGTLLSTSVVVINRSFEAHRAALTHLRQLHALEQFIERWRGDVHQCQQIALNEQLALVLGDGKLLQYSATDNVITRIQFIDDAAVGQETWEVPRHCQLRWQLDRAAAHELLVGALEFDNTLPLNTSLEMAPVALVARVGSETLVARALPPTASEPAVANAATTIGEAKSE